MIVKTVTNRNNIIIWYLKEKYNANSSYSGFKTGAQNVGRFCFTCGSRCVNVAYAQVCSYVALSHHFPRLGEGLGFRLHFMSICMSKVRNLLISGCRLSCLLLYFIFFSGFTLEENKRIAKITFTGTKSAAKSKQKTIKKNDYMFEATKSLIAMIPMFICVSLCDKLIFQIFEKLLFCLIIILSIH